MSYLAIVKVENNRIAKYQDFPSKPDADAHVAKYGGFVVETPASGSMSYWVVDEGAKTITHDSASQTADETRISILRNIEELEITVTPRRLRDALASDEGKTWVDDVEKLIAVERGKL